MHAGYQKSTCIHTATRQHNQTCRTTLYPSTVTSVCAGVVLTNLHTRTPYSGYTQGLHTHTDQRSHSLWAIWIFGNKYSSLLNKFGAFVPLNKTSRRMSKFQRPKQLAVLRECVCSFLFFSSLQFGSLFPTGFNLCVHWASLFLHYPLGSTFCFIVFSGLHHFPQNTFFFLLARRSFSVNFSTVRVCVLTCWYF